MSRLENRIPPPLIALAFALAMWSVSRWLPAASVRFPGQTPAAALVFVAGLSVIGAAIAQFVRARTTVDPLHPEAATSLLTGGIMGLTRNPMYLGMALILAAWALRLGNCASALLVAGFIAYISRFQIAPEERALRAGFGEAFEDYVKRVRRWI